ncbi:glycosyltransferase family 4 protein [Aerosakkonema funiforme]|uniref:Glycosyltransferase family 4 protein n=2 Tax=Oscillatoriophycideae TaxID=1301283 RepID=A0A926VA09_9CYAN|nr:glycosyltransferase family 4 protein [Aerosakkonema funiforme]MBD2179957.1 glycosyltransferase family 4 protein [Aerosakkonema funiforme FACHB-1375]
MKYHIALIRAIDLEGMARDAEQRKCPRHIMWQLSQQLGATIHKPAGNPVQAIDKIRGKLGSNIPEQWALGRALSEKLTSDDLIFCPGEDVGYPVAALCGAKRDRPKIVVIVHNSDRPRTRLSLKLYGLADKIDLFITPARLQADFLRRYLNLPAEKVWLLPDQTDVKFFTPGSVSPDKRRPMVMSVGLEQRDYVTLAEATKDLDIDVKVSGFSTAKLKEEYARPKSRRFPKVLPENMSCQFYEWPDLVQLYRDADIVVISLVENKFAAGIQVMHEALACKRPVIITRTRGMSEYLEIPGIVTTFNPGDVGGLREAIVHLLNNPQEAEAQAQRGHELVLKDRNSDRFVEALANRLIEMGS